MRTHHKSGYVYVAQGPNEIIRIGFTTDLNDRSHAHESLGFHFIYRTDYLEEGYKVEQVAHKLLKAWKIKGSLYSVHREVAELCVKFAVEGVANGQATGYIDTRARDAKRRKRPIPKLFSPHRAPKIMV